MYLIEGNQCFLPMNCASDMILYYYNKGYEVVFFEEEDTNDH